MKILSFGGDRRIHEALGFFREGGHETYTYPCECGDADVFLLPFPTSRDGVTLNNAEHTPIADVTGILERTKIVVGGKIPREFRRAWIRVEDLMENADFVEQNSRLTAEGALKTIIGLSGKSLSDCTVAIIGYGRIAKHLSLLLLPFGCKLKIYTSNENARVSLGSVGISSEQISYDGFCTPDFSGADIIINTAPAKLLNSNVLCSVPEKTVIVELASGDNIEKGVRNIVYDMGIPGKVLPVSCGKLIYEYTCGILKRL